MTLRCTKGFTLVEAMVVVAIIAILTVTIAPRTLAWLNEQGVRQAVEQLRGDIKLARIMAIRQRRNCTITFNSPAANQYNIGPNNKTIDLARYRGQVTFLAAGPDGVAGSSKITFNRRGLANAAQVFITNATGRNIFRIQVSSSGGVSVRSWAQASGTWR